jgi:hypothetical protein
VSASRVPDRLVEVWAAAGIDGAGVCGSGWVLGRNGVLTAGHVLDKYLGSEAGVLEVRLGRDSGGGPWYRCEVRWNARRISVSGTSSFDVALLEVVDPGWIPPVSPSPRLAAAGDRPLDGCDAAGFPDAVMRPRSARETEQVVGLLHPVGGGRGAAAPFDIRSAPPTAEHLWGGFSGAAVRDAGGC